MAFLKRPVKNREGVQAELYQAIEDCHTLEELKDLLFSLDKKDEAIIKAFDKKISRLERAS